MAQSLRADVALVQRALAVSRERAQELIRAGLVVCNGKTLTKCSQRIDENDVLSVTGEVHPYVGRGGCKLERALEVFGADVSGRICIDVGASTGGFTDVLLRNGAARVYAVDVGTGQLDPKLRGDSRVISMEKTNARTLTRDRFALCPELAVMDVSFISIRLVLPALFELLGEGGRVLSLIKPQFEAGPQAVGKNGIVRRESVHRDVLRTIRDFAEGCGWRLTRVTYSPITGTAGNTEFLGEFLPMSRSGLNRATDEEIQKTVDAARRALKG